MVNVLGEDIKDVLNEIGEPVSIYNYLSGNTFQTNIDFHRYWGTRIPFENEYQVLASLSYDTEMYPGDLIYIFSDDTKYIATNKVSEFFEGEAISKECFLYKCNALINVKRKGPSTIRDENYQLASVFNTIYQNIDALFFGSLEDHHDLRDHLQARFLDKQRRIIISNQLDVQINDFFEVYPGVPTGISDIKETWMVELIEANRLNGIKICQLGPCTDKIIDEEEDNGT